MNSGDGISTTNANWKFDHNVVPHFDEHIERSVPMYHQCHKLIAQIGDYFISDQSLIYEIGCSTGSLLQALAERNQHKNTSLIGIEIEEAMASKASKRLSKYKNIEIINEDIVVATLQKSDFIASYYTCQFIKPRYRQAVINKIYESLNWGGAFVLFEKVRGPDARFQDLMVGLYNEYKIENGYSYDEILSKSRSLKGVLEPFSEQGNIDLLRRAGFVDISSVFKYVSFQGFLCIK